MVEFNIVWKGNIEDLKDLVEALMIAEKNRELETINSEIKRNLEILNQIKAEIEKKKKSESSTSSGRAGFHDIEE